MKSDENLEIESACLAEAIFRKYGHDFREYSSASFSRRIQGALIKLGVSDVSSLQRMILNDPEVFSALLQHLTVPTTEMFRDPAFFLSLRENIVPWLKTYPSVKIWIAGCSTGPEVFSLAIALNEEGVLDRTLIYATDINPRSLDQAKRGIIGANDLKSAAENYRKAGGTRSFEDYVTADGNGALIGGTLLRNVLFADHSLATDSVFSEVHLVSCRNVLIYFRRPLQDRAIGLFRDSLCHKGFLALGRKETLNFSEHVSSFDAIDKQNRIFQKK